MFIKLNESLAKAIGEKQLSRFGLEAHRFRYKSDQEIDLRDIPVADLGILSTAIEMNKHASSGCAAQAMSGIRAWKQALEAPDKVKASSVKNMHRLLVQTLAKVPGHRVYSQDDDGRMLAYVVKEVKFEVGSRRSDRFPHVTINVSWEEIGKTTDVIWRYYAEDFIGSTAAELMSSDGVFVETPELREAYLSDRARFLEVFSAVGSQFLGRGVGTTQGVDGNDTGEDKYGNRRCRSDSIVLDRDDEPSRLVVDVPFEDDHDSNQKGGVNDKFWRKEADSKFEDEDGEMEMMEVPIHPYVVVFDLKRHLRLKAHVSNLTEYQYDLGLAQKLVLPDETTGIIEMLLQQRGRQFEDIISGKAGGTIIMCCGRPGVGKTLTAEVYAETMERPLYSVQASQLGLDAESLEKELTKVLARGKRWGAVMLIDEADVYVRHRGDDLAQNAIVGVFLRVLEYHAGALFLTTNRPELIDDAIASRCTARIVYGVPSPKDQARIWRILADVAKIPLGDSVIEQWVAKHQNVTGRDVKNLLKLASMYARAKNKPITLETIEYVAKFKPTEEVEPR